MTNWRTKAACAGLDTELFFPTSGETTKTREAQAICDRCPVTAECRAEADRFGADTYGIWAGTTESKRRVERSKNQNNHGGPRSKAPDPVRQEALVRYAEIRPHATSDAEAHRAVAEHLGYSPKTIAEWVRSVPAEPPPDPGVPRRAAIAVLIQQEWPARQIAAHMRCTKRTVERHKAALRATAAAELADAPH